MKLRIILALTFFLPLIFSFQTEEKQQVILKTGWYYITEERSGTSRLLEKSTDYYLIDTIPILTAKDIKQVSIVKQYADQYSLKMKFNDDATEKWRVVTENAIGKKLAFILDDKLLFAPTVMSAISNGSSAITGDFSKQELLKVKKKIESEMEKNWKPKKGSFTMEF